MGCPPRLAGTHGGQGRFAGTHGVRTCIFSPTRPVPITWSPPTLLQALFCWWWQPAAAAAAGCAPWQRRWLLRRRWRLGSERSLQGACPLQRPFPGSTTTSGSQTAMLRPNARRQAACQIASAAKRAENTLQRGKRSRRMPGVASAIGDARQRDAARSACPFPADEQCRPTKGFVCHACVFHIPLIAARI